MTRNRHYVIIPPPPTLPRYAITEYAALLLRHILLCLAVSLLANLIRLHCIIRWLSLPIIARSITADHHYTQTTEQNDDGGKDRRGRKGTGRLTNHDLNSPLEKKKKKKLGKLPKKPRLIYDGYCIIRYYIYLVSTHPVHHHHWPIYFPINKGLRDVYLFPLNCRQASTYMAVARKNLLYLRAPSSFTTFFLIPVLSSGMIYCSIIKGEARKLSSVSLTHHVTLHVLLL